MWDYFNPDYFGTSPLNEATVKVEIDMKVYPNSVQHGYDPTELVKTNETELLLSKFHGDRIRSVFDIKIG